MAVLLAVELALNIAGVRVVALLNQISVWWHIFFVIADRRLAVHPWHEVDRGRRRPELFAIQPVDTLGPGTTPSRWGARTHGSASSTGRRSRIRSSSPSSSLLQANWTYTGYDASAHVAEETVGARRASAWGIFLSVAVSAVAGYIFLLAITLHLPDLTPLFPRLAKPIRPRTRSTTSATGPPCSTR